MNSELNEIRDILRRWYEGETSPEEESRLIGFFSGAASLPADLEADARLFRVMAAADADPAEIPEEVLRRSDAALTEEIAREKRLEKKLRRRRLSSLRRVGGVAASLLVLLMAGGVYFFLGDTGAEQGVQGMAAAEDKTVAGVDTVPTVIAPMPTEQLAAVSPSRSGHRRKVAKKVVPEKETSIADQTPGIPAEEMAQYNSHYDPEPDNLYLSPEEEEELIAAHYRVITNEQESYALINTVFTRLEGSLDEEFWRMEEIGERIAFLSDDPAN